MPGISDALKIWVDRQKEAREQGNLDRQFTLTQNADSRAQQGLDLQKLAEQHAMDRFAEEQMRLTQNSDFVKAQAGQAGIASGSLEAAPPIAVTQANAAMLTLPGAPTHEAGGLEYAPGQFLKAIPKGAQEDREEKALLKKQSDQRDAFNSAFGSFITAHPDFAKDNKDRLDEALMFKTLGLPMKDETLGNIQAEAVRRAATAYASGKKKGDPAFDSAMSLFKATTDMTAATHPPPQMNALGQYNLASEHAANTLQQDVDKAAMATDPTFAGKTPAQKDSTRRDIARQLGATGKYTSEAVQRYIGGLGAEPVPNTGDPLKAMIADMLAKAAARKAATTTPATAPK